MAQKTSFLTVLEELQKGEKPFPAFYLQLFSDLTPTNVKALQKIWKKVPSIRKQHLLEDLRDLAETDTLTNFDAVGQAFLADPSEEIRILAIRLLWECEDKANIPVYLNMLGSDPSTEVQAAAATALGMFVYLGELDELSSAKRKLIEDALLNAARSADSKIVQQAALESLGFSSRDEVPPLIEAAIHQKDIAWVVSALVAMGHSSDERWEKYILPRLRNANDDIREAAITAAGEIGLPTAREPLLDVLSEEEDVEVRHNIIHALTQIGGEGVREAFMELLDLEEDEEETEFLETALEDLIFTENTAGFEMFDIDPDEDLLGAEPHSHDQ